jgi:biopolymer transport protein ExbB
MSKIIEYFQHGGWVMYPLAFMFIAGIACVIERTYMILFVYKSNSSALMKKLQRLVLEGNIEEAIKLCNSRKDAALHKVLKAGLMNADKPFDEIQEHVQVAITGVVPKLQHRMTYLFTIGNTATLLGLLGTVFGLITTFEAVGAVEGSQKQQLLSAGISEAMSATAFGLLTAVPTMAVYGYLMNHINSIVDDVEHYAGQLLVMLKTGSEYYDNFSAEGNVSTQQIPKKRTDEVKKDEKKAG